MEGTWNRHERLSAPLLVGGFGRPWQRDLDFGSRFVCAVEDLNWRERIVIEDLSYSALHVLHRLQELRPAKVVLVATQARGEDRPGTLRRYLVNPEPPPPDEVHGHLVEALSGEPDLDQTLAVARHWGALPAGSVILEVEPRDTSLGLGLSEEMAASIDTVLTAVATSSAARRTLRHPGCPTNASTPRYPVPEPEISRAWFAGEDRRGPVAPSTWPQPFRAGATGMPR